MGQDRTRAAQQADPEQGGRTRRLVGAALLFLAVAAVSITVALLVTSMRQVSAAADRPVRRRRAVVELVRTRRLDLFSQANDDDDRVRRPVR